MHLLEVENFLLQGQLDLNWCKNFASYATESNIISFVPIKEEGPMDVQMELSQLQPHFSPISQRRQTNTDATGTLSPGGIVLTQTVREHQYIYSSHVVQRFLTLGLAACCVWPFFLSLSHQNYIIDSEGQVMFYKVKHMNGFLSTLIFRCARVSKWQPQVERF